MQVSSTIKYGTMAIAILSASLAVSYAVCQYTDNKETPSSICQGLNKYGTWIGAVFGILAFAGIMFVKPGTNSTLYFGKDQLKMTMKYGLPILALISGIAHSAIAGSSITSDDGKPNSTIVYIALFSSMMTLILLGYEVFQTFFSSNNTGYSNIGYANPAYTSGYR